MNKKHFLLLGLILLFFSCTSTKQTPLKEDQRFLIAFGSCSHQDKEQILWEEIIAENPDTWIWLGDNIYGDTEDMTELRAKYDKQKNHPAYQQLRQNARILGVWDDHDYGVNDGGKEYPKKAESQQVLLDFLDVSQDDLRRTRKGMYSVQDINFQSTLIKIILLDTRYFRDELNPPNLNGTILGSEQWAWLATELENSKADVHIIGSGIQVIPTEHRFEKWENFPNERKRLLNLIKNLDLKNPIFITGDRHSGEVSKIDWQGKIMYDITSSSLTNPRSNTTFEPNQHRQGGMVFIENYGLLEITENTENIAIKTWLKSDGGKVEESIVLKF